jgi:hypothetical protein
MEASPNPPEDCGSLMVSRTQDAGARGHGKGDLELVPRRYRLPPRAGSRAEAAAQRVVAMEARLSLAGPTTLAARTQGELKSPQGRACRMLLPPANARGLVMC